MRALSLLQGDQCKCWQALWDDYPSIVSMEWRHHWCPPLQKAASESVLRLRLGHPTHLKLDRPRLGRISILQMIQQLFLGE